MKKTKFDKNVQILTYKPNICLNSGESRSKEENQQQTQPTYDAMGGERVLVGGVMGA